MSQPNRTSGSFFFASVPPFRKSAGVAMLALGMFSFAGVADRMPAREPVVLDQREILVGPWNGSPLAGHASAGDETARGERLLRVASYNIHQCRGMDHRRDPERIATVIRSLDADIVSLQEVLSDPGDGPCSQVRLLAEKTGMHMAVAGPTMRKADGRYGNALLSRFPITKVRLHDISLGGFEPRGIIDADIRVGDLTVRVVATHFGLWPMERNRQVRRLLEILPENPVDPLIVMGDMNGWVPGSPVMRRLRKRLGTPATMKSFPAAFPLLPLDRIWVLPAAHRVEVEAPTSRLARIASDHLPLVATVSLVRRTSLSIR